MDDLEILNKMEDKYGDLYTFGGVMEYDLIDDVPIMSGGDNIYDDETDGKLYIDDEPELKEMLKKDGGSNTVSSNPVSQKAFLSFLNNLSKLEKT